MELKRLVIMTLTLMLIGAPTVSAAPTLIDYQGYLEDSIGNPITDTLSITFTIYTASSGGTSKWTETQSSVEILGGLFNVTLGSSTALPDTVFNDDTRYLAVKIGSTELTPRTRIVSTAYSHRVETIDGATGGTISGDITAGKGNFGTTNINTGANSFVAGESDTASGLRSVVAGGAFAKASGSHSVVSGGSSGEASGTHSSVGGGQDCSATASWSVVGGGFGNLASGDYATSCGGNNDDATGDFSSVGGGRKNEATADYATVPGGRDNKATAIYAFAAGRSAQAVHAGAFVWGDSTNSGFFSSAVNQFNVRSYGGVRIFTNTGLTAGVTLSAGGSTWNSVSDSTLKRNIRIVQGSDVLSKLMELPIKQWSYKAQSSDIEHIGPMAQDFYAVFGIGEDDKTISSIDPSGIALAAIQEVYRQVLELKKKNTEIELLKGELSKLQEQVKSLAKHIEENTIVTSSDLANVDLKVNSTKQ